MILIHCLNKFRADVEIQSVFFERVEHPEKETWLWEWNCRILKLKENVAICQISLNVKKKNDSHILKKTSEIVYMSLRDSGDVMKASVFWYTTYCVIYFLKCKIISCIVKFRNCAHYFFIIFPIEIYNADANRIILNFASTHLFARISLFWDFT